MQIQVHFIFFASRRPRDSLGLRPSSKSVELGERRCVFDFLVCDLVCVFEKIVLCAFSMF